jgi:3-isopropylmalate dehydrogenase
MDWFSTHRALPLTIDEAIVGGASIDLYGVPIRPDVLEKARAADAILFGAVGGEKWDHLPVLQRPEASILTLRRELDLYANVRPAKCYSTLVEFSSLKPDVVAGLDLVIVREGTSGVYFGTPRGRDTSKTGEVFAYDNQYYSTSQIERVCHFAFELATQRKGRLCSVDKANVMETGALWREVFNRVAKAYPDISISHMYADNCAMQLVRNPKQFDVIVTDNLFGDILSDCAAMLTGSLGMLPSASIGTIRADGKKYALYEPVHGSAPDIAGRNIANPLAMILSFAMCLRLSLARTSEADELEKAVEQVLSDGAMTADLCKPDQSPTSTTGIGDAILDALSDTVRLN